MGIVFGLLTAVFFAAGAIFVKLGQRTEPDDDGVYTTLAVNAALLGVVATFAFKPPWNTAGFIALVAGGVVGSVFGRTLMLRGIRLIGPSRTSAFTTGTPVAAALGGWVALGETVTPLEALGGAIAVVGLLWLVRSRTPDATGTPPPIWHYLIAAAAPLLFGLAFVFRKWGLERFDSALVAAFISATSAFVLLSIVAILRRDVGAHVRRITNANRWFVFGGVATALAIMSQFLAFGSLDAWVVGLLVATQGIWTLGMSVVFMRGEEHIDHTVVGPIIVVASGVAVVALQT